GEAGHGGGAQAGRTRADPGTRARSHGSEGRVGDPVMIRKILLSTCLVLAAQFTLARGVVVADTLDDLLAETQKARAAEAEENKKREAEFLSGRDHQKAMLDDAQAKWNAAKSRSDNLSKQFDANEVTLADLETKLKAREGNLGELFGVTRQVAGDA